MRPFHRCPHCGTLTDGLFEKKGRGYVHGAVRCAHVLALRAKLKAKIRERQLKEPA
jgi:hypothetical protein